MMNHAQKFLSVLLVSFIFLAVFGSIESAKADTENVVVDGFDSTYVAWTEAGSSPYLHDDDADVNYIGTNTNAASEGYFDFADTSFTTITDVHLWFKARFVTAASDNNFDAINSTGNVIGNVIPTTTSYALYQADQTDDLDYLDTPAEVNAFKVYVTFYRVASSTRFIRITYAYLVVTGSTGAETYTTTSTLSFTETEHNKATINVNTQQTLTFSVTIHNHLFTQTQISTALPFAWLFQNSIHAEIITSHLTQIALALNNVPIVNINTSNPIPILLTPQATTFIQTWTNHMLPILFLLNSTSQIITIIVANLTESILNLPLTPNTSTIVIIQTSTPLNFALTALSDIFVWLTTTTTIHILPISLTIQTDTPILEEAVSRLIYLLLFCIFAGILFLAFMQIRKKSKS